MSGSTIQLEVLAPITGRKPAGSDAVSTTEWPFLIEARREEPHDANKGNHKVADWRKAEELALTILSKHSKDLLVATYLLEAKLKRYGFAGLRDGLIVVRSLITEYWDLGLYPTIEDGDLQYRARPLEWLISRMPQLLYFVPLLKTTNGGGEEFCYARYLESNSVGREKDINKSEGDGGLSKRTERKAALARGEISGEMFDAAVAATKRSTVESIANALDEATQEFTLLSEIVEQKFVIKNAEGEVVLDVVPDHSAARKTLDEIRAALDQILQQKLQEPDEPHSAIELDVPAELEGTLEGAVPPKPKEAQGEASTSGWENAERLVRERKVSEGLTEMARLAASEHGRVRFERRLRLAEIYLETKPKREKLATSILEELNEQIKNFKLEQWESSELIARVWGNLYRCYKEQEGGKEKAAQVYQQLCRLDPWQAWRWE